MSGRQRKLRAGLTPGDHYDRGVAPHLAEHVSSAFEELCRDRVRADRAGSGESVGRWWGRQGHTIDIVAAAGRTVTVAGECKRGARLVGLDEPRLCVIACKL